MTVKSFSSVPITKEKSLPLEGAISCWSGSLTGARVDPGSCTGFREGGSETGSLGRGEL